MPVSLGETTITRATCASRIPAIAHALPVTSNATQSRGSKLCANSFSSSGRLLMRPADRSRPASTIATSQKSRWISSATALTLFLLAVDDGENRWANDIDGSALAAQPGKSQGRPLKSPGSKPIAQNGLPSLRSPEGPCPSRPNLRPAPDNSRAFKEQFHAARRGAAHHRACSPARSMHLLPAYGRIGTLCQEAREGKGVPSCWVVG